MELFAGSQFMFARSGVLFAILGGNQLIGASVFRSVDWFFFMFGGAWLYIKDRSLCTFLSNLNVVDLNVYYWVFVILCPKKLELLLDFRPFEGLNCRIIKGWRSNISITSMPIP